jgi:multidrug efflux system membrane fusion protein
MRRNQRIIAAVLGLAAGLSVGCKKESGGGASMMMMMPPPLVVVGQAKAADVPVYIDGIGKATAIESVTITPRVPGQIIERRFEDGSEIKKGQVLFLIDARPYQATLAQAKAQLAQSKASLDLAQIEYKRYLAISDTPAVSKSDLDTKKNAVDVAKAQIEAADAAIQSAEVNLDYCTISSPIEGRAGSRMVDVGNVVMDNQTSLLSIQRIDPIYADFTVNEQQLADVRANMAKGTLKTLVSLPGDGGMGKPGVGREGALTFLDNAVQSGSGTVRLRATVPNADGHFWPGQFVNVRLVLRVEHDAVLVPNSAPQMSQAGEFVFVVKEGVPPAAPGAPSGAPPGAGAPGGGGPGAGGPGAGGPSYYAELRPVVTGQGQGDNVVILKGLAAGEKIVVDGQMMVRPNGPVRVGPPGGGAPPGTPSGAPAGAPGSTSGAPADGPPPMPTTQPTAAKAAAADLAGGAK